MPKLGHWSSVGFVQRVSQDLCTGSTLGRGGPETQTQTDPAAQPELIGRDPKTRLAMPTGKFLQLWKVFAGYLEIALESFWTTEEVTTWSERFCAVGKVSG